MLYTEVIKHWHNTFAKMGYQETKPNNWFKETRELIVVLRVLTFPNENEFFVDVAVIIKKLYHHGALNRPLFRYAHLGRSLWLLIYLGSEKQYTERYLNNLFRYNSKVKTDEEVVANISELAKLYQTTVVPLFDKLDYWVGQDEDFNEKTTWKPFFEYFEPTGNTYPDFC